MLWLLPALAALLGTKKAPPPVPPLFGAFGINGAGRRPFGARGPFDAIARGDGGRGAVAGVNGPAAPVRAILHLAAEGEPTDDGGWCATLTIPSAAGDVTLRGCVPGAVLHEIQAHGVGSDAQPGEVGVLPLLFDLLPAAATLVSDVATDVMARNGARKDGTPLPPMPGLAALLSALLAGQPVAAHTPQLLGAGSVLGQALQSVSGTPHLYGPSAGPLRDVLYHGLQALDGWIQRELAGYDPEGESALASHLSGIVPLVLGVNGPALLHAPAPGAHPAGKHAAPHVLAPARHAAARKPAARALPRGTLRGALRALHGHALAATAHAVLTNRGGTAGAKAIIARAAHAPGVHGYVGADLDGDGYDDDTGAPMDAGATDASADGPRTQAARPALADALSSYYDLCAASDLLAGDPRKDASRQPHPVPAGHDPRDPRDRTPYEQWMAEWNAAVGQAGAQLSAVQAASRALDVALDADAREYDAQQEAQSRQTNVPAPATYGDPSRHQAPAPAPYYAPAPDQGYADDGYGGEYDGGSDYGDGYADDGGGYYYDDGSDDDDGGDPGDGSDDGTEYDGGWA